MGFHVEAGSPTKSPLFVFNHCGCLPWGGIEIADMTEREAWLMRCFVEVEAYRQGYFSSDLEEPWNPFEPEYLYGQPYNRWEELFNKGKSDRDEGVDYSEHEYNSWDKPEPNLWPSVIAALHSLAAQTKQAYLKIGVERKSFSHGMVCSIVGWFNTSDEYFVSEM